MENNLVVRSLDRAPLRYELPEGDTVYDIIDMAGIDAYTRQFITVLNHGSEISDWSYVTKPGDNLAICIIPQGGGGGNKGAIIGAIAMIAIAVAAPYAAAAIMGTTVGTLGAAGTALSMGITLVGAMAVSALIPPPVISNSGSSSSDASEATTYALTGQSNRQNNYGVVPRLYGRHKMFPMIASTPIIDNAGTLSTISALYDFGSGDIDLETIYIGDTPASNFDAKLNIHQNTKNPNLSYVYSKVAYEQVAYTLAGTGDEVTLRTKPDSNAAALDILFPAGLVRLNEKNGDREAHAIDLWVEWRDVNGGGWNGNAYWHGCSIFQTAHNAYSVLNNSLKPFVVGVHMTFPYSGQFEVRVYRHSARPIDEKFIDECRVTMLKSFQPGQIVNLQAPHTLVELQVHASDKLSGSVSNLNAIGISRLRACNENGFTGKIPTRNPAYIVLDILCGESNPKPLREDQIDFTSFARLAAICDEQVSTSVNGITYVGSRYWCDLIVDYSTTVQALCSSILSGCRAQLILTQSGKYGVLIDNEQPYSRQMFTPENSWGFKGNRQFIDQPDAFRVTFINPDAGWVKDEFVCYNDGYNASNARKFEVLETFGITGYGAAWRFARYQMAQGIHRSEVFTINVDVENLAVQKGERVSIAHDVPSVGGTAMRITQVWGDHRIQTSQKIGVGFNSYTIRFHDGKIKTGVLNYVVDTDSFDIDTTEGIQGDELIVLGMTNRVTFDYLILEITPGEDLTAEIKLVPYVPGIYKVDLEPIPSWHPNWGDDGFGKTDLEVIHLTARQKIHYPNRYPVLHIDFDWEEKGTIELLSKYLVYLHRPGMDTIYLGEARDSRWTQVIDIMFDPEMMFTGTYEFIPVNKLGVWGIPGKIDIIPERDVTPPIMPQNFNVNIQSETAVLFWSKSLEPDVLRYELRYTADYTYPSWNASQHLATVGWDTNRTSAGARTGCYMIRAIDSSGNKSDIAYQRTTVEKLPNVELVTDIDDKDHGWYGWSTGLTQIGNTLWTSGDWGNLVPSGEYNFKNLVDLQGVYEVRVSSKIQAYGEDYYDLMINWPTLASVPALARADGDDWDAWLEYRTVEIAVMMSDWLPDLTSVTDIAGGGAPWSEWRAINVGDITAKLIQFRIQTRTYSNTVKVVLIDGSVEIDAADRMWSKNDVTVTPAGLRINFDPAFMFNDVALAINIDGNDQPVVSKVSNKSRTGFDLMLIDTVTAQPADGKVDVVARGQGRERLAII